MARRQSSRPRSTRSRQEAPAKSARRASAPVVPVAVVAEADNGSSAMTGMAVLTTVLLLAAFLCVDAMLGGYGEGLLF